MPIKANTPKLAYVLNLAKPSNYRCRSVRLSIWLNLALAFPRHRLHSLLPLPVLPFVALAPPASLLLPCKLCQSFIPMLVLARSPTYCACPHSSCSSAPPSQFCLFPPSRMHVPSVPPSSDLSVNCIARTCSLSPSLPSLLMLLCFFNVSFVL